ncbi:spore germination protein [Bacillus sp. SL00103]
MVQKYTQVTIMYIDGIVQVPVLKRKSKSGSSKSPLMICRTLVYLRRLIEANVYSPFPQIQNTERPDKVASALNNGRVAIFVDHSPFVLVVPASLATIKKSDDYYERWIQRLTHSYVMVYSIFLTLFLSAIYIALVSFHQGLLPTTLAITISSKGKCPLFTHCRGAYHGTTIELSREAGLRPPNPLGHQTIGLVGGVVIGHRSAVQAYCQLDYGDYRECHCTCILTVPHHGMGMSFACPLCPCSLRLPSVYTGLCCLCSYSLLISAAKKFWHTVFLTRFVFSYKNEDNSIIRCP